MAIVNNRYELQQVLGQGGMGAVYAAFDRLERHTVALKSLSIRAEHLIFDPHDTDDYQLAIAREFQILASLRHPNIISVLDFGFDEQHLPFFTMPLLTQPQTITKAARELNLPGQIDLLIQVLQALAYLHRRGIVHRDLKPANILVENNTVKVLDFGLAMNPGYVNEAAGTLPYMPPELLESGKTSVASDLYAVGVIAYEIFAGRHPFWTNNISQLIRDILRSEPDLNLLFQTEASIANRDTEPVPDLDDTLTLTDQALTIPLTDDSQIDLTEILATPYLSSGLNLPEHITTIQDVVGKLLRKLPSQRYQSAYAVIEDLCRVTYTPLPPDSQLIRESFIQAAKFVGRTSEISRMQEAISAARNKQGSLWLIGGESGVGKTRLLEELRTLALVNGMVVVRSQALGGAGLPYELWRDILPRLILDIELTDLEASVLKTIVPDIDLLLERTIEAAETLPGIENQQRLHLVILDILARYPHPLLILLEDLHWSVESLHPLREMADAIHGWSTLIIGSYRHDESPDLPKSLPHAQVMFLDRLSEVEIAQLSISMLGNQNLNTDVLKLIHTESEGNTFFIVEVVRTLAEEAGRLADVGMITLPAHVFTGGMQRVIQRRLTRVPEEDLVLLQTAAVYGRQIDRSILKHLHPALDIEKWLYRCGHASVLAAKEDQWHFAHDKIREAIVVMLSETDKATLHGDIAAALEHIYADDPSYIDQLAEHWRLAGRVEKEMHYIGLVADRLINISAYARAELILNRGLILAESPRHIHHRIQYLQLMGDMHERLSQYDQARKAYIQCIELARQSQDESALATALYSQAMIYIRQTDYGTARHICEEGLIVSRRIQDRKSEAYTLNNLGLIERREANYAEAGRYHREALVILQEIGEKRGIGSTLNNLGNVAWRAGDYDEAEKYYRDSISIEREIGRLSGVASSLSNLGLVDEARGNYAAAREHYLESISIKQHIGDPRGIAATYVNLGTLSYHEGDFVAAGDFYKRSLGLYEQIGDKRGASLAMNNVGLTLVLQGEYSAAQPYFERSIELNRQANNRWGIAVALQSQGDAAFELGDYTTAYQHHHEAMTIIQEIGDKRRYALALDKLGLIALETSDLTQAHQRLEESLALRQEIGDKWGCAHAYHHLGLLAVAEGQPASGAEYYRQALHSFRELGEQLAISAVLADYAIIEPESTQAQILLAEALEIAQNLNNKPAMLQTLQAAIHLAFKAGNLHQAAIWLALITAQFPKCPVSLNPLRDQLLSRLESHTLEAARQEGATLDIKALTSALLKAYSSARLH